MLLVGKEFVEEGLLRYILANSTNYTILPPSKLTQVPSKLTQIPYKLLNLPKNPLKTRPKRLETQPNSLKTRLKRL